ncbi:DUF4123 domain-containing protein [Pseudomonas sp. QE6]|uniref:DUF4123 domain-containing protein n=1 Tax=Pseudomonas sp. QE6 TaxID=3242491 RepID=UPI0035297FE5
MQPRNSAWFDHLIEEAQANRLGHIDLLLDATGLAAPLPAASTPQLNARLFDNTPEQALAEQGAHLRRISLDDPAQLAAAHSLIDMLGAGRVLALLSKWPFEPLATHLRHCTQAHWGKERHNGLLRFYDPRLLRTCCETLLPNQSAWFHAPAIAWYWRDSTGQPQQWAGQPQPPEDTPSPLPALHLSDSQLFELVAWSEAVRFCDSQALTHRDVGLPSQDALHRHVSSGIWAAQREQIMDSDRDEFLLDWIGQQHQRDLV